MDIWVCSSFFTIITCAPKNILVCLLVYTQSFSSVSILEENCWINKVNEMLRFIRQCKTASPDSCINLMLPSEIIEEILLIYCLSNTWNYQIS